MSERPANSDRTVLPADAARRLLARASELDAVRRDSSSVADLRAAAVAAGISTEAFEAALAEMRQAASRTPDAAPRSSRRGLRWTLGLAAAVLIAVGAMVSRAPTGTTSSGASTVEESILLECLAPGDAAELVRPVLRDRSSQVTHSVNAPRVLVVRATPERLARAKAVIAANDGVGSTACVRR